METCFLIFKAGKTIWNYHAHTKLPYCGKYYTKFTHTVKKL